MVEREKKYLEVVEEWNCKYWLNRKKIRLLVGDEQAKLFLDYEDDSRQEDQVSLHYTFVRAHKLVLETKDSPERGIAKQLLRLHDSVLRAPCILRILRQTF
jgi:hypothetical protein